MNKERRKKIKNKFETQITMYRININSSNNLTAIHQSPGGDTAALADVIKNQLDTMNPRVGGIGNMQRPDDLLMATVKVEPNQDVCAGTSNNTSSNGHLLYAAVKRPRVDG